MNRKIELNRLKKRVYINRGEYYENFDVNTSINYAINFC